MKNFLLFATGISFCIFISCQQTSSHKPFVELSSLELSEEEMPMVSISNDFACSFFQKMNEQEKGQSFFISPLSAQFNLWDGCQRSLRRDFTRNRICTFCIWKQASIYQ